MAIIEHCRLAKRQFFSLTQKKENEKKQKEDDAVQRLRCPLKIKNCTKNQLKYACTSIDKTNSNN